MLTLELHVTHECDMCGAELEAAALNVRKGIVRVKPCKGCIERCAASSAEKRLPIKLTSYLPKEEAARMAVLRILREKPLGLSLVGIKRMFDAGAADAAELATLELCADGKIVWYMSDDDPPVKVYLVKDDS